MPGAGSVAAPIVASEIPGMPSAGHHSAASAMERGEGDREGGAGGGRGGGGAVEQRQQQEGGEEVEDGNEEEQASRVAVAATEAVAEEDRNTGSRWSRYRCMAEACNVLMLGLVVGFAGIFTYAWVDAFRKVGWISREHMKSVSFTLREIGVLCGEVVVRVALVCVSEEIGFGLLNPWQDTIIICGDTMKRWFLRCWQPEASSLPQALAVSFSSKCLLERTSREPPQVCSRLATAWFLCMSPRSHTPTVDAASPRSFGWIQGTRAVVFESGVLSLDQQKPVISPAALSQYGTHYTRRLEQRARSKVVTGLSVLQAKGYSCGESRVNLACVRVCARAGQKRHNQ